MKNHETSTLKGLEVLAKEHLQLLKKGTTHTGKFDIAQVQVAGYQELLFTLRSLINVCILALDNVAFSNSNPVVEPDVHIKTVLELAVQLIPFEEGEFLDKITELLLKKEELT